jgi:non-specific serine/threonine protein kinase
MSRPSIISRRFQVNLQDRDTFIGQGGMGSVYRGHDTQSGKTVAVKILKTEMLERDPDLVQRFQREGEALRQLNHPNIVKMLGSEDQGGVHYLIMEYVEGGSLLDILTETPKLSIQRAMYIALDLADALTRAHRLKILHRDIKPGNVLLASDGTPRLTDFGMARVSGEPHITQDGAIVGTMAYLAPEAFQGEEPDERTDIWAFGVMLYEMLAGERPFPQVQAAPLIQAIIGHPVPDIEAVRPDAPTALIDLVYRMLEKNRQARIPSVRLIGAELEAILRGSTTSIQHVVSVEDSTGRFELATTELPILGSDTHRVPNNLPKQPTPFVGREKELEQLQRLLVSGTSLITLTGSGGIGKSRIAQALAEKQLFQFTDGVYVVPFAGLDSVDDVVPTIAEHIDFIFGSADGKADLINYLREKRILLVFDNFETVMDAADIIAEILAAAPQLVIVVTSRERLRLRGEQVFEVDVMRLPKANERSPESLAAYPVVQLFLQSAKRTQPDFELDEESANDVAKIIHLLGGLPLGIELAAGWLEILPLGEITTEIEKSLDFLETDLRDVPERHRSLRAVTDHSWNLLNDEEREVFLKLSVFRGGFEREAAQSVTGASLRTLTILVNKSLIVRDPEGRYRVHKLLRQYAEERFNKQIDEKMATYKAHANYYSILVAKLASAMNSSKESAAINILDKDIKNIRQVWRLGIQYQQFERLDFMQDTMLYFYLGRSMLREGYEAFKNLADTMEKAAYQDTTYWRARVRQAWMGTRIGLLDEAMDWAEKALAFFVDDIRSTERAYALVQISYIHMIRGEYQKSIDAAQQTVEHITAEDDIVAYYMGMGNLGYAYYLQGKLKEAREIYEALDSTADSHNYSPSGIAYGKNNLGEIVRDMGEIKRAQKLFQKAYEIFESTKRSRGMAFSLLNLAGIYFQQGDYQKAHELYERSYDLSREVGDRWGIAHALSNLGNVAMALGDHPMAGQKYQAALTIRRELNEKRGIADSLSDLAFCAATQAAFKESIGMLDEALAIRQQIGDKLGEGLMLTERGLVNIMAGENEKARPDIEASLKIGEEIGSSVIITRANAGLGELAVYDGDDDLAMSYFKKVLRENDADEAPLPMILWALLGIARLKVKHGDTVSALRMLSLILRYPHNYINIIEKQAKKLMSELTQEMDGSLVEDTMSATKSVILKNFVAELLAED